MEFEEQFWEVRYLDCPCSSTRSDATYCNSRDNRAGIDRESDFPAAICPACLTELLETGFPDFLFSFTGGSVDSHRGAATAGCYILTLGVNLTGRFNYYATSTTGELFAIRLAVQYLVHLLVPSKAVIITDFRAVSTSVNDLTC